MKRTVTTVAGVIGMLLTTSLASAQAKGGDFGKQGEFIISADRLLPLFNYTHVSIDGQTGGNVTKNTSSSTQTSLSFLFGNGMDLSQPATAFFTVPRVGFDYVVVPNVTVGGDLIAFFTLGGSQATDVIQGGTETTTTTDNPSTTVLGIAPRGGYILPLTDLFSLWLRGGFSYYSASSKVTRGTGNNQVTQTTNQHQLAIDLDPQFVLTPVPHLGFTAGLTADIPLAGGVSVEQTGGGTTVTTSNSASVFYLGLTVGMLGYF